MSRYIYEVADSRSKAVADSVLGKDFSGVLVSDCYVVYDDLCKHQQKCYAHHLKVISQAIEQDSQDGRGFLKLVRKLLKRAMAYNQIRELIPPDDFATICQNLEQRADELIPVAEKQLVSDPERTVLEFDSSRCPFELQGPALAVAKRLAKQRDHLFTFLYFEEVPATNNLAERRLRPAVISRKVSCGNKTEKGMNTWKILTSILNTFKQTGDSFLQTISRELSLR